MTNLVYCRTKPSTVRLAFAALGLAAACPSVARAGDMDGVGAVFIFIGVYVVLALGAAAVALWQCRHIANRRVRAFVRFLILVLLFTPIPTQQGDTLHFTLAFLFVPINALGGSMRHGAHGVLHYPVLLAYGIVLVLGSPLLMAWTGIGERQRRRRASGP